jgi:hypothetical protein
LIFVCTVWLTEAFVNELRYGPRPQSGEDDMACALRALGAYGIFVHGIFAEFFVIVARGRYG